MAGDSSASQHLLLKWKGVHETGSTPTPDHWELGAWPDQPFRRLDYAHASGIAE